MTLVSPTTTYAEALLVGCIAISAHLLTQRRPTWAEWLCAAAFLAALSGAKSTVLPIVLGGYVTILVLRPLARRALPVGIFGLVGLTVGVELLAQRVLYGGSTRA